jgi:hypothetical protein
MKTAAAGVVIERITIPNTSKVAIGGNAIQYIGVMESVTEPAISPTYSNIGRTCDICRDCRKTQKG